MNIISYRYNLKLLKVLVSFESRKSWLVLKILIDDEYFIWILHFISFKVLFESMNVD